MALSLLHVPLLQATALTAQQGRQRSHDFLPSNASLDP